MLEVPIPQASPPLSSPALPYFARQLPKAFRAHFSFDHTPPWVQPSHGSKATQRGLSFERKVTKALSAAFGLRFAPQLPLVFQSMRSKAGRAIPDGLLLSADGSSLCLIEIKLQHSADAWHQLERFYLPILREATRDQFRLCCLEICKLYDPWVRTPRPVALLRSVSEVFETREHFHPVLATRDGGLSHAESPAYPTRSQLPLG